MVGSSRIVLVGFNFTVARTFSMGFSLFLAN